MIKIDVISGFLGAGKTTLIKKLFESGFHNDKVVLIENEFGEIGIDGAFLKDSGVNIKEINSGCICCSLVGDFAASMKELITTYNPDRIIVEPSGVGKLSDIIKAIDNVDAEIELNILATVVDGAKCKMYLKNFGEFFIDQVDSATSIIVNKIDKMSEEKLLEVVNIIKEKNPSAQIITTPLVELDSEKLLEILESKESLKEEMIKQLKSEHECCHHHEDEEHECCHHHEDEEHECCHHHEDEEHECCHHHEDEEHECCHHHEDEEHECCHHHEDEEHECCHHHEDEEHECCHHHEDEEHECCHHHHHHHGHDADEVFTSWGIETPKSISKSELELFLNNLANDESLGMIVRAKGILKASDNDKWYYFDFVSGDYEIRLGNPDYTGRLCVIGSKIDEHKIENLFINRG